MGWVYEIVNKLNNKRYIGSTNDIATRKRSNFGKLNSNKHGNSHLQNAFNKYGYEAFELHIITECEDYREQEQHLLDTSDWCTLYNINKFASGGDILSYHPDREGIVKRISLTMKSLHAEVDNPWVDRSMQGDKNPNWRGGSISFNTTCPSCGGKKDYYAFECHLCTTREGDSNSFYGKKHTEDTKEKLRLLKIGKDCNNNHQLNIDGVVYRTTKDAAEALNLPLTVVHYRCKVSTNYMFAMWTVVGVDKVIKESKGGVPTEVVCKGMLYSSYTEAAKGTGLKLTTLINRVKSKNYPEFIKAPQAS